MPRALNLAILVACSGHPKETLHKQGMSHAKDHCLTWCVASGSVLLEIHVFEIHTIQLRHKKLGYHVWLSKQNSKNCDKFKFSTLNLFAYENQPVVRHIMVAMIPAWVRVKTGVQKFIPTSPRPSMPWRRKLDSVSLKSRYSYVKPWLKILSKERKCHIKIEEDINQMCCSVHHSHMSIWSSVFLKKVFYLTFKFSVLVGTNFMYGWAAYKSTQT